MGWEKKKTKILPSKDRICRWLKRKLWKKKGMRKVGTQDRPSKLIFTSAVPRQLRKTIDRISSRTMKRQKFKRMLGIKSVFMVRPTLSSRSTRPKFILGVFWEKTLKRENCTWEKWESTTLPYNVHNCRFLNWKLRKQKNLEKSETKFCHPKFILAAVWEGSFERNVGWEKLEFTNLPSKTHSCKFLNRKLWKKRN